MAILDAMPSGQQKSENEDEAAVQEKSAERLYRTTMLYSATMPVAVERLARKVLN